MRYTRLEGILLGAGALMVAANLLLLFLNGAETEELFAQLLLFVVLAGATHWGRAGGFAAAALASLLYLVVRIPLVMETHGLTLDVAALVGLRIAAFGVLGIAGGELLGRLRYMMHHASETSGIDEWSQTYDERLMAQALDALVRRFERYQTSFSVLLIGLAPALTQDLRPARHRVLVRGIASHLRTDVRLVDEIGRLDDGRFIVLLPHTPAEGARIVADRLCLGVSDVIGVPVERIEMTVLSAPDQAERIASLRSSLGARERQGVSGR